MQGDKTDLPVINNIAIIGHGSIGRGTIPLIKRHFKYDSIVVIDPDPEHKPDPKGNVSFVQKGLTEKNYKQVLGKIFKAGEINFCVNLSVETSSSDIMIFCQQNNTLYVDTVTDGWAEWYENNPYTAIDISNYANREQLHKKVKGKGLKPTAISCCGANPGSVSWYVKKALVTVAKDLGVLQKEPTNKKQWAELMQKTGVKGVHIAERDLQRANIVRQPGQFWNTWSIDGFIGEGFEQVSELGWGTHEKWMPKNGEKHDFGCKSAIYLRQPGMATFVKTWCPTMGPQFGFLITHEEAISISNFFEVKDEKGEVTYRPTCHYAYHPCEDAVNSCLECIGAGQFPQNWDEDWTILESEIIEGTNELGVLLYGHQKNAYWYGSQLSIHEARKRAPCQNATGLQVTSAVIAGMIWALKNPEKGLCEPDDLDYKECLDIIEPYCAPLYGTYTDWNPLKNKTTNFNQEAYDETDPWQFKNVVVHQY